MFKGQHSVPRLPPNRAGLAARQFEKTEKLKKKTNKKRCFSCFFVEEIIQIIIEHFAKR